MVWSAIPRNCIRFIAIITVRVFENRLLRRIFGPKRDKVTGKWRK
jgi:hypothetical protein